MRARQFLRTMTSAMAFIVVASPVLRRSLSLFGFRSRCIRPSTFTIGGAPSRGARMSAPTETDQESVSGVHKTEKEWKEILSPAEYHVLREKGTERPWTGEYESYYPAEGYFVCRGCGNPLYSAAAKFKSGCGWPAFDKCYENAIKTKVDNSFGMRRVEIMCNRCGGHLGHVFEGERMTDTNERHCVNSLSVKYVEGSVDNVEKKLMK